MKILVTGSNGLVGNAVRRTQLDGVEYVFITHADGDLRKPNDVDAMIANHRPDVVLHLAAKVGGLFMNMNNNSDMFRDNLAMNVNMIDACVKYDVERCFICLSTCIFPDCRNDLFTEEDLHLGAPHWSNYGYACAKRYAEVYAEKYEKQGCHTKFHFLIPTNIYGPNDHFNDVHNAHVVPALITKAYYLYCSESEQSLAVAGDGTPLRQFMYADDLAKVFHRLVMSEQPVPRLLIVTPSEEHSIAQLARSVCRAMGIHDSLTFISGANGQMRKRGINDRLLSLQCMEGFEFTPLEEGIKRTVNWVKSHPECMTKAK